MNAKEQKTKERKKERNETGKKERNFVPSSADGVQNQYAIGDICRQTNDL
jgi:hypothetical protein